MNLSSKPIGYTEHLHKVISEAIHLAETFELRFAKFASLIQCRGASAMAGDGVPIRYTLEDDGVVEGNHAAPPLFLFIKVVTTVLASASVRVSQ